MAKLNRSPKRSLMGRVDQEVEKMVYRVMTNEGLEQTVVTAIQKALIDLVKRYFLLIGFGVVFVLLLQAVLLGMILKMNLGNLEQKPVENSSEQ